jgi:hypothetical protein
VFGVKGKRLQAAQGMFPGGQMMATKCGKSGCEEDANWTVRFAEFDLGMNSPIALCEEHSEEILQEYEQSNVAGVKEWLNSPLLHLKPGRRCRYGMSRDLH